MCDGCENLPEMAERLAEASVVLLRMHAKGITLVDTVADDYALFVATGNVLGEDKDGWDRVPDMSDSDMG